jgi:putative ABC transport system substrate-binding protein
MIDRRHFLLTSLALLAAPLAGEAQQSGKVYRIGLIVTSSLASDAAGAEPRSRPVAGLMRGLRDHGYTYGRDFVTEPRSTESMVERIPTIAAELTELKVDVVVAGGPALTGLKQARFAIPVVMSGSPDPVRAGLVASLSRPGGTFTGMSLQHAELDRKRLELLTQIVRNSSRFPVVGAGVRASDRGSQGASVCGSVTVPGAASAARRARSRYALGSTPQSFADSIRL